jgi:hypothetical protein
MNLGRVSCFLSIVLIVLSPLQRSAFADEGWWLFSDPPRKLLKDRYQFDLTDSWLDHVRLASVRFSGGGSGSFVSTEGLILTNHHVVSDTLQDMRTGSRDYVRDGYLAISREQEVRCPDLSVKVLVSSEDVTSRVLAAMKPGMTPVESAKARRAAIYALEKEALGPGGRIGEVVELYEGSQFHLYRYKEYTDIRIVFAPDSWVAREFDICLLRTYEGGKPARIQHYFETNLDEPAENELVLISGNPALTRRHLTVAAMQNWRDQLRGYSERRARLICVLEDYRAGSGESISQTEMEYHHVRLGMDLRQEELKLLAPDSDLMRRKKGQEDLIRAAVGQNPQLRDGYATSWDRLAELLEQRKQIKRVYDLLGEVFSTRLTSYGQTLVRLASESTKPDSERLEGYNDANLPALKRWLEADVVINEPLEILKLADSIASIEKEIGPGNELARMVLSWKKPNERAVELVRGSQLGNVGVRRALARGGPRAVDLSKDPIIALAKLVDGPGRRLRTQLEDDLDEQIHQEYSRIAAAIQAVKGPYAYPDATGTLRLSFGRITRIDPDPDIPIFWNLQDLFRSLQDRPAVAPPQIHSALEPRSIRVHRGLQFDTPFAFQGDADGTFGNSGSPVLNRQARIIGVIHRGPNNGMRMTYEYDRQHSGMTAIHMASVFEVLQNVYGALELLRELKGLEDNWLPVARGK